MPKCRTCPALIVWAKTEKGKNIPLDAEPEKRFVIIRNDGDAPVVKLVETYQTHFVSCPNSNEHRRPRG